MQQKVHGMRRLLLVLAIPILTTNFTHFLLHVEISTIGSFISSLPRPLGYMALSSAYTIVLLYLFTWFSTGVGMKIHSQTKAVITAVATLTIPIFIPLLLARMAGQGQGYSGDAEFIAAASPVTAIRMTELFLIESQLGNTLSNYSRIARTTNSALLLASISTGFNFLMLLSVRRMVRHLAPRMLQRTDGLPDQTKRPRPDERVRAPNVRGAV